MKCLFRWCRSVCRATTFLRVLKELFEVFLGGGYFNWELICVDDGSTDSTSEILKRYSALDSRIKCFHQRNGGVAKARNTCIERARGKYLAWVDPDDTVEPEFLSSTIPLMESERADYCVIAYHQKNLANGKAEWQTIKLNSQYSFYGTEEILRNYLITSGLLRTLVEL